MRTQSVRNIIFTSSTVLEKFIFLDVYMCVCLYKRNTVKHLEVNEKEYSVSVCMTKYKKGLVMQRKFFAPIENSKSNNFSNC